MLIGWVGLKDLAIFRKFRVFFFLKASLILNFIDVAFLASSDELMIILINERLHRPRSIPPELNQETYPLRRAEALAILDSGFPEVSDHLTDLGIAVIATLGSSHRSKHSPFLLGVKSKTYKKANFTSS